MATALCVTPHSKSRLYPSQSFDVGVEMIGL